MTTTTTKGRVTGALALTMATDQALNVGDFVHVIAPYKVALSDGTKPIIGTVTVRSVKRVNTGTSASYPVATTTGGQITVDVKHFMVLTRTTTTAITAGQKVGVGSTGALAVYTDGSTTVAYIGIALTTTTGTTPQELDILS